MSELNNIALKILEKGKGILAADESTGTMTKRLDGVNVPSTPENRLLFRETLFSASGMTEFIGGVILYDETIKQQTSKKNLIPELILNMGSFPGIKVDTGAKILAGSPDEKITEGLDGLRERLKEYYKLGAKFTKWRGVYNISKIKSSLFISSRALALDTPFRFFPTKTSKGYIIEQECCFESSNISSIIFSQFSSLTDFPI